MHLHAESVAVDTDEGSFVLELDTVEEGRVVVHILGSGLDAFYDQVKARIGPYLREKKMARLDREIHPVVEAAFVCAPADVDESAGLEEALNAYDGYADASGYSVTDPKHPDFHSIHADIWDARDGK